MPATFSFSDANTANPQNQLKHNKLAQGKDKEKWFKGMSNALGRLTQEFGDTKGNKTFFFVPKNKIPKVK